MPEINNEAFEAVKMNDIPTETADPTAETVLAEEAKKLKAVMEKTIIIAA